MAIHCAPGLCKARLLLLSLLLVLVTPRVLCFKEQDFKKCKDAAFCNRNRRVMDTKYAVLSNSIKVSGATLTANLQNQDGGATFALSLTAYNGIVRLKVEEPGQDRYQVKDVLLPKIEQLTRPWTSDNGSSSGAGKVTVLQLGTARVTLTHAPFRLEVDVGGEPALALNSRSMFAFEHRREKKDGDAAGLWEESFNGHADSKPKGPEAISLDLSFPGASHLYGIPEHATGLALQPTTGLGVAPSEPYRLYNLDVFMYLHESPFGLYGSIPLLLSHKRGLTVGAFWLNAAEQFVDVLRSRSGSAAQWIAESGVIDLFVLLGPTPAAVLAQYASLTGATAMPQLFALGYHQCRWNYKDDADARAVDAGFDEHAIPYDVLWLDIEHTDGKRYMTWDSSLFPDPQSLQDSIASRGRRTVTIVDPHVKRDSNYYMHAEAEKAGHYVKNKGGTDFDGWCWPGSSSYLDVTSPVVRDWWALQFALDKYQGSTQHLYIWNDMNEPSVFNGPEITMPKDNLHYGGVEHRDLHNIFGMYYHMATAAGLEQRGYSLHGPDGDRPFVLSRAFFAGTQRVGPIWTGDNTADWNHLKVSVPMLLTLGLTGLPFSGADVGGFFGNPDAELLTRWYQVGTFYPFFRGHAHLETQRREPWLFGEATTSRITGAIRARYALLPYIYTLFRHANLTGSPVMRPLWYEFPDDPDTFAVDEEFLLGPALLVRPVLQPGVKSVDTFLPRGARWYDSATGMEAKKGSWLPGKDRVHRVKVTLDAIPSYYRGGHIVPRRERARRATPYMTDDPYTLVVALSAAGTAAGDLYLDDGRSFAFKRGAFAHRNLSFSDMRLRNSEAAATAATAGPGAGDVARVSARDGYQTPAVVERIVILGLPDNVRYAAVVEGGDGRELEVVQGAVSLSHASGGAAHIVRRPNLPVSGDWTLLVREASKPS